MTTASVSFSDSRASTLWSLAAGQALTLSAAPAARVIEVKRGRLWLTRRGRLGQPALDHWVRAGERITVGADDEVVVEGWPRAQFEVLERARPTSRSRFSDWLERLDAWRVSVA